MEAPQRVAAINSYASPTPVVEDGSVYVHFGTYGTACLNSVSGEIRWRRRDLKCDHETAAGPGSSPMVVGDQLVVNVDGRDVQYVIAMDKASGKTVWKTNRSVDFGKVPVHKRKAYCMPTLVTDGSIEQLVSPAAQAVIAYTRAGEELWKVRHQGWSIAPRAIFGHGLVYTIIDHDHPELWAIRPHGRGDVTETHVAWREKRGMPSRSTPILTGDLIFLVSYGGIVSCLKPRRKRGVARTHCWELLRLSDRVGQPCLLLQRRWDV